MVAVVVVVVKFEFIVGLVFMVGDADVDRDRDIGSVMDIRFVCTFFGVRASWNYL